MIGRYEQRRLIEVAIFGFGNRGTPIKVSGLLHPAAKGSCLKVSACALQSIYMSISPYPSVVLFYSGKRKSLSHVTSAESWKLSKR